MEAIEITPQELRDTSSEMIKDIEKMRDALNTASNVMEGTKDSFDASSASAIREKYSELRSKFDNFYQKMESYCEFLDKTAEYYENADNTITNAANDILQS